MKKKNTIIISLFFLFYAFPIIGIISNLIGERDINIITNKLVDRGVGWKDNQSLYAGSELNLIFINSSEISFEFDTNSKADQGVEIFVNKKEYSISSPNIESQKLSIKVDKKKQHTITVKHFCSYLYDPCQIILKGIYLNRDAKLLPYQHHDKILSILGDSISTIYGKENYAQTLAEDLKYELHNASIMGSTVSKVKGADNAILRYKKDLMNFKSDIAIIFLGTNDAHANIPLDTFEQGYLRIISDLKSYNPKGKIFLVGILPRKDIDNDILENYNAIIQKLADSHKIMYINPSLWLTENDFSDAIHPSFEAQEKIAEHFKIILSPFLR